MAIVHAQVRSGEGFMQVARRLSPPNITNSQATKFANEIAAANGLSITTTTLRPGQVLHIDDTQIPVAPTLPPPVVTPPSGKFYVKRGSIGRDGKRFVPIGLNVVASPRGATGWWNDQGMACVNGRSAEYARQGYNFARLTCMGYVADSGYSEEAALNGVLDCIDELTARGIAVMPAYHGFGPGNFTSFDTAMQHGPYHRWLDAVIDRAKSNPLVWINPLNEPWGYPLAGHPGTSFDDWMNSGLAFLGYIRGKGCDAIVVWDLVQWAQGINWDDEQIPIAAGTSNFVLGFHNYGMKDVTGFAENFKAAGVALIVGETGYVLGDVGTERISTEWCASVAQRFGMGFVGWWGAGNRNDTYVVRDRRGSAYYDTTIALSSYGRLVEEVVRTNLGTAQPDL